MNQQQSSFPNTTIFMTTGYQILVLKYPYNNINPSIVQHQHKCIVWYGYILPRGKKSPVGEMFLKFDPYY
jgi:hypothetical protein